MLAYGLSRLPPLSFSFIAFTTQVLLLTSAICLAAAFFWILIPTVRQRTYRLLPAESDQIEYAKGFRAYHEGQGLKGDELEAAIVTDLRAAVVDELAQATEQNRELNRRRLAGRSNAIFYTFVSLGLAVSAVALMFMSQWLAPVLPGADDVARGSSSKAAAGSAAAAGQAAQAAGAAGARRRAGVGLVEEGGTAVTRDSNAAPAAKPEPAQPVPQPAPRPERPQPQYMKKGEDGGGPIGGRRD